MTTQHAKREVPTAGRGVVAACVWFECLFVCCLFVFVCLFQGGEEPDVHLSFDVVELVELDRVECWCDSFASQPGETLAGRRGVDVVDFCVQSTRPVREDCPWNVEEEVLVPVFFFVPDPALVVTV